MERNQMKIGVVGCGAIGSGIARAINKELDRYCCLSGLYDIDRSKAVALEKELEASQLVTNSQEELIAQAELIVEAVSRQDTRPMIRQALEGGCHVLAMSVGQLLQAQDIFALAQAQRRAVLVPSGAIAGLDALKAARLAGIEAVELTTRKPIKGLLGNAYFDENAIDLRSLKKETLVFEGAVAKAVKHFPQNINVAAALALACGNEDLVKVRLISGPELKVNSHEIVVRGAFGRMVTRTENEVSPINPKTSYLAVLSGIQSLKQFCAGEFIGT